MPARSSRSRRDEESYLLIITGVPEEYAWQEVKDIVRQYGASHVSQAETFVQFGVRVGHATIRGKEDAYKVYETFCRRGWNGRRTTVGLTRAPIGGDNAQTNCIAGPASGPAPRFARRGDSLSSSRVPNERPAAVVDHAASRHRPSATSKSGSISASLASLSLSKPNTVQIPSAGGPPDSVYPYVKTSSVNYGPYDTSPQHSTATSATYQPTSNQYRTPTNQAQESIQLPSNLDQLEGSRHASAPVGPSGGQSRRSVIIRNLPTNTNILNLCHSLSSYGTIESCQIGRASGGFSNSSHTGDARYTTIVLSFSSSSAAEAVVRVCNGKSLADGVRLRVELFGESATSSTRSEPARAPSAATRAGGSSNGRRVGGILVIDGNRPEDGRRRSGRRRRRTRTRGDSSDDSSSDDDDALDTPRGSGDNN